MVRRIYNEFNNIFKSEEEEEKFKIEFNTTLSEFFTLRHKILSDHDEMSDKDISDIFYWGEGWRNTLQWYTDHDLKNQQDYLIVVKNLINKYKHPHSSIRDRLISKNSGRRVSPRDKQRGIDIWDADNKKVERDDDEYRKKKSTKSKPKRKVIKKCKCK
jgi:hypothetical protein